jgi:hypothetical protein
MTFDKYGREEGKWGKGGCAECAGCKGCREEAYGARTHAIHERRKEGVGVRREGRPVIVA